MADIVDTVTLINRVVAEDEVEKLSREYDKAYEALGKLIRQEQAAAGFSGTFSSAVQAQAEAVRQLGQQVQTATQAARSLGGGFNPRALLEFSRAAEDAQYGIAGVLNNIPGLVAALGGGPGLAGAISLGSVGLTVFIRHFNELITAFGGGHVRSQAEEMEELRKKTEKTAEETERLAKWEETRKRIAAQGAKPEAVSRQEAAVDKAISEAGIDSVNKGLDKNFGTAIQRQAEVDSPGVYQELQAAKDARDAAFKRQVGMNKASPGSGDELVAESLSRVEKATAAANEAYANARGKFSTDPANAARIQKAAKANPGDFGPNGEQLAKGLSDALNPQQAVMRKAAKEAGEAFGKWWGKLKEEAAEEAAKQAKADATAKAKAADEYMDDAAKSWDDSLKAAQKSRSWAGKKDEDMTPAELLAKQEHDQSEAKIATARRNQSWLGREDSELSPEERTAKQRFGRDERDRKERQREVDRAATERRREQSKAPGLDDYIRDSILQGASEVDVDKQLRALGIDAKGRNELLSEGTRNAYGKRLADMEDMSSRQSQTFGSGVQLRDAIQGGVKSEDLLREQITRLKSIEDWLMRIEGKEFGAAFAS